MFLRVNSSVANFQILVNHCLSGLRVPLTLFVNISFAFMTIIITNPVCLCVNFFHLPFTRLAEFRDGISGWITHLSY